MSDCFEYCFFPSLERNEVPAAKSRVLEAFWSRGLLEKDSNPSLILGGGEAYGPTPKLASLFSEGDKVGMDISYATRGVEVCEGFAFQGWELNEIECLSCPKCNVSHDIDDFPISDEITKFHESGKIPNMHCSHCETSSDARLWKSDPSLTFTYLGFAFWNWMPLKGYAARFANPPGNWSLDIPKMMEDAAESPIAFSYGRL